MDKDKENNTIMDGDATRIIAIDSDFARNIIHLMVLICKSKDGHVYAKYIGSPYGYVEWYILVHKTLTTNAQGHIK